MNTISKSLIILGIAGTLAELPAIVHAQESTQPTPQSRAEIIDSLRISRSTSSLTNPTNSTNNNQNSGASIMPTSPQAIPTKAIITDQGVIRYNDQVNVKQYIYDITPFRTQTREGDAAVQVNIDSE